MPDTPRIITARKLGLGFRQLFGELGPERNVTGHYSAGPRAENWRQGVERARSFHAQHANQGWGGCGYHFIIADDGTLICMRPTIMKGAHVGGHNTQNLGVNCPGTTGHRPTGRQKRTYRWLLANAHTNALPSAHRTDVDLRDARLFGHNSWDGHTSNGCPGLFKPMYLAGIPRFEGAEEGEPPEEELDEPTRTGARGDYPEPERIGDVVADHRNVGKEEAEEAQDVARGEREEQVPEADPDFDEDEALQGADLGEVE